MKELTTDPRGNFSLSVIVIFIAFVYPSSMAVKNGLRFATRKSEKLKEPEEFRVILLNDHFTTMDFVIDILVGVFHKSEIDARRIMLDVHHKGKGIVGQYPWDIAQTKAEQVHHLAREREFPLRCVVEPV